MMAMSFYFDDTLTTEQVSFPAGPSGVAESIPAVKHVDGCSGIKQ